MISCSKVHRQQIVIDYAKHHYPANTKSLRFFFSLFVLLSCGTLDLAWSETYRCKDSSGHTIHTDSRAQLEHCELLSSEPSRPQRPAISQPPPRRPSTPSDYTDPDGEEPDDENDKEELPFQSDENSDKGKTGTVMVPVQRYGGSLIVPVTLNNEKNVRLILDTGATTTVLSTEVAIELGLTSDSESQIATVNTAGGPVQVNLTRVKSMGINGANAKDVVVAIHDLPDIQSGIDGLLGMSFLNNFLVTLDSDQGQLYLRPRP